VSAIDFKIGVFFSQFIFLSDVALEETNHLYVAADLDHDDRLSYKEIIDKYDVFVGMLLTPRFK
jgi:hypothetical protein